MTTISCFGPGIRPDRWIGLYNSLNTSKVDFDLTILGPNEPDFKLPDNLHYIKTNVKPAQCAEIGFRSTQSEFAMPVADDEIFSDGALDTLLSEFNSLGNDKSLVSCRFKLQGKDISEGALGANKFYVWDQSSPLAETCPLMKRESWKAVGGVDRRFIGLYWDLDLFLRVKVRAQHPGLLSRSVTVEEVGNAYGGGEHSLYMKYGPPYDRRMLDSFWTVPPTGTGAIQKHRLSPVESYEDKDILTITQGPKGEWN